MRTVCTYIFAALWSLTSAHCPLTSAHSILTYPKTEAENDTAVWNKDPLGLETVVVTATRTPKALSDIPVVTRVITAEDIKKVDATNVKDMLQQEMPGLEFTFSMGQQVMNMNGYDGNNILFLIDGERMAGESVNNIDYARLDMQCVERIEIVRGAASTVYGSAALGGVINIITKSPSQGARASVSTRYEGATKEWRHGANVDLNAGKVNSLTSFQMTDADSLSLKGEEASLNTAFANRSYNVRERLTWDVSQALRLTGRAGFFFRERDSSQALHERYRDLSYGAKADWRINELQDLEVACSFDQYDKSDLVVKTRKDVRDYSNRQSVGRALYNVRMPSWRSVVTGGMDFMNDYLLSYQFADERNHRSQNSYDAFAQWDYTPSSHWNVVGGLRYDYFSAAGKGLATWKVAGMYKAGRHSIRASYASGFRAPSLKELYMDFFMGGLFMLYGNEDLKCETNHNFALAWENHGAAGENMKYGITVMGYYNFFNNYITTATVMRDDSYAQMYTNVKDQQIAGVDVDVQLRHQNGMGAKMAYAYVRNVADRGQNSLTAARPHSLTWRMDYSHRFTRNYDIYVALSGRFLSAVEVDEYTSTNLRDLVHNRYEGYSIWKLSASQHIGRGISLNCAIDNLFNYRPRNYYANSPLTTGTTLTAGVTWEPALSKTKPGNLKR